MKKPDMAQLDAVNGIVGFIWQPEKDLIFRDRFYYKIIAGPDRSGRLKETNRQLESLGWEAKLAGGDTAPFLVVKPKVKAGFPWLAAGLFAATILSVIFFPPYLQYGFEIFRRWELVAENLPFALGLMGILTCHEAGHFFAAKRLGVEVSFPYFIPGPTILGTFGAVIRANAPFFNRRELMEVAAAGPIAGLVVAIPALIYGLLSSQVVPEATGGLTLGDSLLTKWFSDIIWGKLPEGYTILISPLGFAGWAGLLVTMLNLLPIGSLDGGHIAYALFGKKQKWVARLFWVSLFPLGFWFTGWWMWALLAVFFRLEHPPTLDDGYELTTFHKTLGWLCLVIFILIFIPVPLG
ncbi:MAG: site-2 protease family protein [candidate division Zixibacteria bacterium]|nr:site-2 protease family protein [candidate division Zixibacteria bacterium]